MDMAAKDPWPARDLRVVPGLVWAFRFDAQGRGTALPLDAAIVDDGEGWIWLHLQLADARARQWAAQDAPVPAAARALLASPDEHQQLQAWDGCIGGVIADLVRELEGATKHVGRVRFAMTDRLMISGRRQPLEGVEATRRAVEQGHPLAAPAALLEAFVEHVAAAIGALADSLNGKLDGVEDRLLAHPARDEGTQLARLRRVAVRLHRPLAGLRALFQRLEAASGGGAVDETLRVAAHRLGQRLDALDHEILAIRARARMLQDEISASVTAQLNRNIHVLSIIATVFLPATLVAGIFGMNTKDLWFTDVAGGSVWAVLIAAACSAIVVVALRWLRVLG
jgi:zinc transporter